jgi:hypothetical protein
VPSINKGGSQPRISYCCAAENALDFSEVVTTSCVIVPSFRVGLGADVFVDAVGVVITWVDIVVSDIERSSKPHTTCLTQIVANSWDGVEISEGASIVVITFGELVTGTALVERYTANPLL